MHPIHDILDKMSNERIRSQHSLDLDDVFDDDVTILANGSCRFIYANATDSCRNCALIGQTCSPQRSATHDNGCKGFKNESESVKNDGNDGCTDCVVSKRRSSNKLSNAVRNVRFSDSVEYTTFGYEHAHSTTFHRSASYSDTAAENADRSTWPRAVSMRSLLDIKQAEFSCPPFCIALHVCACNAEYIRMYRFRYSDINRFLNDDMKNTVVRGRRCRCTRVPVSLL